MKKLVSILVLTMFVAPAIAAPSHISRTKNCGYNVTYDYKDKEKTGWYVGGRAELSFLNWKNKYSAPTSAIDDASADSDSYSFEPVFGGALMVGHNFAYPWRGEIELGYIGNFSDKDDGFEFELSIPYIAANALYDFDNGVYVGATLGAAAPTTKLDGAFTDNGHRSHTGFGVMGGLMAGYSYRLDTNLMLDLRYRFAVISGTKQTRNIPEGKFENKINMIMDNSLSIGLRYEF